jgi:hypothetical protein
MSLTADFIRALSGLSPAELSTETIDTLQVISMAEAASANYTFDSDAAKLHYEGYKAITLLGPSLLLSVPETVKDNFNSFSRFEYVKDLLDEAAMKVASVEGAGIYAGDLLSVVPPEVDPVTQEAR